MSTCKCGKTKLSVTASVPGCSVQLGCPVCKATVVARS